ncbi:amine oxidase [Halobacillus fulvus]|nr:amine oxidase [Halobacillus fulvus]
MNKPVIIVGAGLSGLRAASLLSREGVECKVLEARDRVGGRVMSTTDPDSPDLGTFDLGPTWFWPQYETTITHLIEELDIRTFDQYTKGAMLSERVESQPPERLVLPDHAVEKSVRIAGGVQTLVDAVAATIPEGVIELAKKVTAIRLDESGDLTVEADRGQGEVENLETSKVILALPPRMIARYIEFSPSLPPETLANLTSTSTWMAGQAKAVVIYDRPFWRQSDLSGFATSWVGPLQEIHDASPEKGSGALFGFFGMPAKTRQQLGEEEVMEAVIDQLVRLFGTDARNLEAILYKDWSQDPETAVEEDQEPLRDFPTYGPPPVSGVWEKKIAFAGTETATQFGGHLEGALKAAERAVFEE